jgi:hypothetical protein
MAFRAQGLDQARLEIDRAVVVGNDDVHR